jgi:acyl-CoA synthetase (AMP-forming)/AMP-acid ligase II
VDEVLIQHPAIAQAIVFAVPHATLGEDVAAAVILHENATVTESEIRGFASARLADFKVPSQVIIVEEIPKGPTGKVQRTSDSLRKKMDMRSVHDSSCLRAACL